MRRIPFHPLLLAILPVLFLFVENRGQVLWGELITPVLVILVAVAGLFGVAVITWRDAHLAAAVTSLAVILLLWHGPIHTALEGLFGPWFRYRYSLVLALAILAAAAALLIRRPERARAVTSPANIFCLILAAMLGVQLGAAEWRQARFARIAADDIVPAADVSEVVADTVERRSIYYIILDGYARDDVLRDLFSFDNSGFTAALRRRGFHVHPRSRSNYAPTILSLASSLNGAHLTRLGEVATAPDGTGDRSIAMRLIRDNRVMRFLAREGYTIVNIASGWAATERMPVADVSIRCGPSELTEVLLRQTAAWPLVAARFKEDVHQLRLCQLRQLSRIPDLSGPKFVLAHLLIPHPPYVFTAAGERLAGELTALGDESPWQRKELYVDQLRFVNRAILPVLDTIMAREDPAPIIILQSDHGPASRSPGPWDPSDPEFVRERMSILNAVLLPDGHGLDGQQFLTPVNTFPLLLNAYFGTRWSRSEDISYMSYGDTLYLLTRVDTLTVHASRTREQP